MRGSLIKCFFIDLNIEAANINNSMKKHILWCLLLFSVSPFAIARVNYITEKSEYSISKVLGKPQFKRVMAILIEQEKSNIAKDHYRRVTFVQHLKGNTYLARIGGELVKLETIQEKGKVYTDDAEIHIPVVKTDRAYQYTAISGGKKTVSICKELKKLPDPTTDGIVDNIRNGKTYQITKMSTNKKRCKLCDGWGKVPSTRTASRKAECRTCEGEGKLPVKMIITVKW
jgi:hypothetical protein